VTSENGLHFPRRFRILCCSGPDEKGTRIVTPHERLNRAGLGYLTIVYVIWGSTYLAIRVAVREGAGFPPFILGAMRVFAAAAILIAFALLSRHRVRLTRPELIVLAGSGLLLWTGGNGLVTWGETHADSGLAALLVGSMPIWVAMMEAHLDRRLPTPLLVASLLTGFAGIGLLAAPVLIAGSHAEAWAVIGLLIAPITWGAGSIWQRRRPPQVHPVVASGYQHLFGGIGYTAIALLTREPLPTPTPHAWAAWAYLVVFGSLLGFTSYVQTLRRLPMNVVMTYCYVNPVVAVILGRLILGEAITGWTIGGTALVLLGVAGVFRDRALTIARAAATVTAAR
jgi:drug/metabolite transporter (DMT)-like permease